MNQMHVGTRTYLTMHTADSPALSVNGRLRSFSMSEKRAVLERYQGLQFQKTSKFQGLPRKRTRAKKKLQIKTSGTEISNEDTCSLSFTAIAGDANGQYGRSILRQRTVFDIHSLCAGNRNYYFLSQNCTKLQITRRSSAGAEMNCQRMSGKECKRNV